MHKDKPPGVFDFAQRSVRYLVGFWLTTGFVLSLFTRVGVLVWHLEAGGTHNSEDTLETATAPVRKPTAPPADPTVRY
jgi:hypothetical protein